MNFNPCIWSPETTIFNFKIVAKFSLVGMTAFYKKISNNMQICPIDLDSLNIDP